eukprot:652694_1
MSVFHHRVSFFHRQISSLLSIDRHHHVSLHCFFPSASSVDCDDFLSIMSFQHPHPELDPVCSCLLSFHRMGFIVISVIIVICVVIIAQRRHYTTYKLKQKDRQYKHEYSNTQNLLTFVHLTN